MSVRRALSFAGKAVGILGILALALVPLIVLVFNAMKTTQEFGEDSLGPPRSLTFSNYEKAWEVGGLATGMRNSAILAFGTAAGVCVIAGMAAYALGYLRIRGESAALFYLFFMGALPAQLFIFPLFALWRELGLFNSLLGLMIIYWAVFSPFYTLLLRSYILTVPREFGDSARVDGAHEFQIMWRIVIPLVWPGFLAVALLSGVAAWTEFFFAYTFIFDDNLRPVTTSFLKFQLSEYSTDWPLVSAASVIVLLPILIVFVLMQRRFIAGFSRTGLR